MNTFTKELKQMIGVVTVLIGGAFVALVALFVTAGGLSTIGVSVLMLVLVAFVACGSAVIVDEYHAEQRRQIARAHWYELDAVRYMRDEYADTLSMVQADERDERYKVKRLSAEVQDVREALRRTWVEKYTATKELTAQVATLSGQLFTQVEENAEQLEEIYNLKQSVAELAEQLDEYRYMVKAEHSRVADI
jgi:ABC-type multidrug transport system fused ATPase/permease subunit